MSSSPFVCEDFKLSPMSHDEDNDAATNSDVGEEDELSELSTTSPCTPNSPMRSVWPGQPSAASGSVTQTNVPAASASKLASSAAGASLLPLIERPRRMTKREQLDRLDLLEEAKKTRKLSAEEKKEFQRLRRRKQNRDAAATSRDRKRDYTSSLEGTIKLLQEKQAEMQRTIDNLLKERQAMLKQLKQVDATVPAVAEVKDAECSKHGKKRGLAECVNDSSVLSDCPLPLNSSLPLLSAAELAMLSTWGGSMNSNRIALPA